MYISLLVNTGPFSRVCQGLDRAPEGRQLQGSSILCKPCCTTQRGQEYIVLPDAWRANGSSQNRVQEAPPHVAGFSSGKNRQRGLPGWAVGHVTQAAGALEVSKPCVKTFVCAARSPAGSRSATAAKVAGLNPHPSPRASQPARASQRQRQRLDSRTRDGIGVILRLHSIFCALLPGPVWNPPRHLVALSVPRSFLPHPPHQRAGRRARQTRAAWCLSQRTTTTVSAGWCRLSVSGALLVPGRGTLQGPCSPAGSPGTPGACEPATKGLGVLDQRAT